MKKLIFSILIVTNILVVNAQENNRVALIIGNSNYTSFNKLPNAENDVKAIAEAVRKLGFDVTLVINADRVMIRDSIIKFRNDLSINADEKEGFFWYAGHGQQYNGENYLIPVNSAINHVDHLETDAISLGYLMNQLRQARNKANIVVLDACRNNELSTSRSGGRGLSVINNSQIPPSSLILYSTAANAVASDGNTGDSNSPFAIAFLRHINNTSDFDSVFRNIARETLSLTNNQQEPTRYGQILTEYYLNDRRQIERLFLTLRGHTDWVQSAVYSPNEQYIVSGAMDNTIRIWYTENGRLLQTINGHTGRVMSVRYSYDGRFIISSCPSEGLIKIWEASSGRELRTLYGYKMACSPISNILVSAAHDGTGYNLYLWNIENGTVIKTFSGYNVSISSISFSSDGRYIASGSDDNIIKVWNIESGNIIQEFRIPPVRSISGNFDVNGIYDVKFSPDGSRIVSASERTIKMFDLNTGREIFHTNWFDFMDNSNTVSSIDFSPSGNYIIAGSMQGIKIYTMLGIEVRKFSNVGYVNSVMFSNDGRFVLATTGFSNEVYIWNIEYLEKHNGEY